MKAAPVKLLKAATLLILTAIAAILFVSIRRPAAVAAPFPYWLLVFIIVLLVAVLVIVGRLSRDVSGREKAEATVLKIQLRYQSLIEMSPVGLFYTDVNGYTTYVNPQWCLISGLPREKALGNGWLDAVHEDDKQAIFDGWMEAAQNKELSIAEYRFVRPDGSIKWVMGQAIPERNEDNRIIGYVGTITDITKRKIAEEKLKSFNQQLNLSQAIAHVGYWERDLINGAGYWSDEMFRLFELKHTEQSKNLAVFMENVHPDDRGPLQQTREDIIANGHPISTEFRYILESGEVRHFMTRGQAVYDRNGQAIRMEGITQDITARKKIEHEILKEKQLSDSLINSLPGAFYLYTQEGKFLRWNRHFEEVTLYSGDEIRRMHPLDFFDEDEKELMTQKINNVFIYGKDYAEAHFLLKTKEKIPYYFTGKAIEYEGKLCLMGVGIDISKTVEAQEKTRQTSEQLRQLAAHLQEIREEERAAMAREIHDELGQQLTGLKMDVYWLKEEMESPPKETVQQIEGILKLLDQTINTVRKIAAALRPPILDDLGLVEALKLYSRDFQKRFAIDIIFNTDLADVPISPKKSIGLFRIFQESLTNVARHADASRVVCSLERRGDNIVLKITDDGKGFDMEKAARKKTLGLIGMAERMLVMEGKCDISSRPGGGTEVLVTVPLQPVAV